jgi:hypothetical protein
MVSGPTREGRILDVFAKHSCALFISTSEQIAARVMLGLSLLVFEAWIVIV